MTAAASVSAKRPPAALDAAVYTIATVVEPAVEGVVVPLVGRLALRLRQRLLGLQRVVDDDDVGTPVAIRQPCASHQAGKAIEARCDFRWRGGTLMITRRLRPSRTAARFPATTSKCQFAANGVRGLSSRKQRAAKLASRRAAARGTPPGRYDLAGRSGWVARDSARLEVRLKRES